MKTTFSKINYYRYKRDQDERLNAQTAITTLTPQADQLLETSRNAFQQGRNDDALVSLGKLLQIAPQNYDAHFLMGRVYERRGDFERATNALKAAIFWNPRLVAAHVLLGRIAVLKRRA
jgi:Flp pilus assembly protein TadD